MSTDFQDFLERTAQEEMPDGWYARQSEWRDSVNLLINKIRGWIESADPKQVLEVSSWTRLVSEQGLGEYPIESLKIRLGSREVSIAPIGRNVVGRIRVGQRESVPIEGRVDASNGAYKFILYRILADHGEQWVVTEDGVHATELNQSEIERILQYLLS